MSVPPRSLRTAASPPPCSPAPPSPPRCLTVPRGRCPDRHGTAADRPLSTPPPPRPCAAPGSPSPAPSARSPVPPSPGPARASRRPSRSGSPTHLAWSSAAVLTGGRRPSHRGPRSVRRGLSRTAPSRTRPARVDASYADLAAAAAGAGAVVSPPGHRLTIENSFVSSVGWVKPGDTYPFRIIVTNPTGAAVTGASVTVTAPRGTTFTAAPQRHRHAHGGSAGEITWNVTRAVAATGAPPAGPPSSSRTRPPRCRQEPTLVWRDLSTTATRSPSAVDRGHGDEPRPEGDPAGDDLRHRALRRPAVPGRAGRLPRPRARRPTTAATRSSGKINSPDVPGSTFNLYQEMSLRAALPGRHRALGRHRHARTSTLRPRLRLHAASPAAPAPARARPAAARARHRRRPASTPSGSRTAGTSCRATPTTTARDATAPRSIGAVAGVGALQNIDSGCGPTGKAVYDAAADRRPGDRLLRLRHRQGRRRRLLHDGLRRAAAATAPRSSTRRRRYDNIWPHSSSLEYYYTDPDTGQPGYISDDQLKDLEGRPLYYTDATRARR